MPGVLAAKLADARRRRASPRGMGFLGNTMRALIVYGTTEGQTHKIAERIAARVAQARSRSSTPRQLCSFRQPTDRRVRGNHHCRIGSPAAPSRDYYWVCNSTSGSAESEANGICFRQPLCCSGEQSFGSPKVRRSFCGRNWVATDQDPPPSRRLALHRIRLFHAANRQIHCDERRRLRGYRTRLRVH